MKHPSIILAMYNLEPHWRVRLALLVGPALVALVLSPLLIGVLRPVGGDPDRLFRALKGELAQSLRVGEIPFWSDRLGLGFPLLAESHAGALYPPNAVLYRLLDVDRVYDVSMWAHHVALALAVALYARSLGIAASGAALASVAFSLGGFLSIHSSHEWAYHALLYAVLVLLAADRYATTGRLGWLAALALASGVGWTVGHFQMQAWGLTVAAIATLARLLRLPARQAWGRGTLLVIAIAWGGAIAAAQLAPSWELARWTGSDARDRLFYSYPPAHVAELAWPGFFRSIDPEHPYWFAEQTTGYETCLFVGIPALILAMVGAVSGRRSLRPWLFLTAATFAMATLPRWWPAAYQGFTAIPLLGLFRCPARWAAFTGLGLALMAGAGLDSAISGRRFWAGMILAVCFAFAMLAMGLAWRFGRTPLPGSTWINDLGPSALVWIVSLGLLLGWRRGRVPDWALVMFAVIELAAYYYHSTTAWGQGVSVMKSSPVFARLAEENGVGLVAGPLDDLPLRAGLATAEPYVGFTLDPLNATLRVLGSDPRALVDPTARRWLNRYGVTHAVVEGDPVADTEIGTLIYNGPDAALDRLARSPRAGKRWRLYRRDVAATDPVVATQLRLVRDDRAALVRSPIRRDETLIAADDAALLSPSLDNSARMIEFDRLSGHVEHPQGPCLILLDRIDYPGWSYRLNDDGPWRPTLRVEGGRQAVWVDDGRGESDFRLRYEPSAWPWAAPLSLTAAGLAICMIVGSMLGNKRLKRPEPAESTPPHALES